MNHEITNPGGIPRAHSLPAADGGTGTRGAFVSKWRIRKSDLTVLNGSDLIQNVASFDPTTGVPAAKASYTTIGPLSIQREGTARTSHSRRRCTVGAST